MSDDLDVLADQLRKLSSNLEVTVEENRVVVRSSDPRIVFDTPEIFGARLAPAFAPHSVPSVALASTNLDIVQWVKDVLADTRISPLDLHIHLERVRAVNDITVKDEHVEDRSDDALDYLHLLRTDPAR